MSQLAQSQVSTSPAAPTITRKIRYVVGLAFNKNSTKLLTIRKNKPAWQAGKLNGLGGKIELGETPIKAMIREFKEESGIDTNYEDWKKSGFMSGPDFEITVFSMFSDCISQAVQMEDEHLSIIPVDLNLIAREGISNLVWMVSLALDQSFSHFNYQIEYIN